MYYLSFFFLIENEFFTEKCKKKAACTSQLPSFPSLICPSYIHIAALIFYKHVLNIFMLHSEQKKIMQILSFLGVWSP